MIARIVPIVEGFGEVAAVSILLRRTIALVDPNRHIEVRQPIRVKRQKLVQAGELERVIELAARQASVDGAILVLLDSDEDCPAELAPSLLQRARAVRPDRRTVVVLAKREYEAWFVAAAESLAGARTLPADLRSIDDPESLASPKGWIDGKMFGRSYRETLEQPALTAILDLDHARAAPSFDKFRRDIESLLSA